MTDFFAMGGYAAYLWPAYGFTVLVLIVLLAQSWRSARRRDAELEQVRRFARPGRPSRPRLQHEARSDHPANADLAPRATE